MPWTQRSARQDDVSARVLRAIRDHLGDERIAFGEGPRRLAGGAFTSVFSFRLAGASGPWAGPLVLRFTDASDDATQPLRERALHNGAAEAGFPAPRILLARAADGTTDPGFVIMERIAGRARLRGIRWDQFVRDFPGLVVSWPTTFAEVTARLHATDTAGVWRRCADDDLDPREVSTRRHLARIAERVASAGYHEAADAVAWLRAQEPVAQGRTLVHGDLWPANVLMHRGALTGVVDWNVAGIGDPELDTGFAAEGLALMPAPFPPPPPIAQVIGAAGRSLARRIVRDAVERHGQDPQRIVYYRALRCLMELARAAHGLARRERPPPPWANGAAKLAAHFRALTGVPLAPPTRR